jgi:hypothetical protein
MYPGVFVQIPTAPVDDTLILLFPLPSAMMILFGTKDSIIGTCCNAYCCVVSKNSVVASCSIRVES